MKKILLGTIFLMFLNMVAFGQTTNTELKKEINKLKHNNNNLRHRLDQVDKAIDDVLWFQRVGDAAFIDKIYISGPPLRKEKNPTAQGAGNPVKFWSYVFIPKWIDHSKKYPLLVFPHGGVHGDHSTYYTHIIKEMMAQGYIVVCPEYRGSTGYGRSHYEKIDYGGLEVEDVYAAKQHMLENYEFVDKGRVGMIGWSHGGLISLFNVFNHPKDYKCAFVGVPVSDLVARMGYKTQGYRNLYSADFHIGKTAYENVNEYRRRSPAWNAAKLKTPLRIHTNTIDADVNVLEVEHLIQALKAEGKKFEYKIYKNIPGGHSFDRMDRKKSLEIRLEIYKFLAKYLKPPKTLKTLKDIRNAAYRK